MDKLIPVAAAGRSRQGLLLSRTALCGVLTGLSLAPAAAIAQTVPLLPEGGVAQVNAGGGMPTITTGGAQVDVTLHAPRTVISWTTFNVAPDNSVNFRFDSNSWIVLNKVVGLQPSKIEGIITGKVGADFGGNVWFLSNNSLIFGKTAQVDVGGFLAAIGSINTDAFLNTSSTLFSFSGSDALPDSRIYVLSGGRISGHGGFVGFAGPSIITRANALVTADRASVLYGSAKSFQIRLAPGTGGNFDMVDFLVPDIGSGSDDGVAADLAGETKAGSVFVAAVSKTTLSAAVVNIEGMITATGASADGGDIVLSGGGGIVNRQPGPTLADAAPTDIYLNKASASRDLLIKNVGHIFARPWIRPIEMTKDPTTLDQDANTPPENGYGNGNGNGYGNGNGNGNGFNGNGFNNGNGFAPLQDVDLTKGPLAALFDPTAISAISTGRDAKIQATQSIELGRVVANRDVSVSGPEIKANSLIASGGLTATASKGDILLAGAGVGREGVITGGAAGDVKIAAVSAPQKLTITSSRDIVLGDGTSAVTGAITLKASQNITMDLASAKLDSVTAGVTADLRGGALDIGSVTAPRLLAKAQSVKIGSATSTGDIYVIGTNGDAILGSATAGDDVFVLATHGTASLGSATLTGGPDGVSFDFDGNPDASGNGKVVRVESADLDARLGLGVGAVTGATKVSVKAGQDAVVDLAKDAPGAFSVVAARDATLRAPTARLDTISAGRDLTFATTAGDLTLGVNLSAARNISIIAGGALKVADVRADAGSITLGGATVTAGAITASDDVTLKATSGGVTASSVRAGRDLAVQGGSLNVKLDTLSAGRDVTFAATAGDLTLSTSLTAARNISLAATGALKTADLRTDAGGITLAGASVATGALTASDDLSIKVTSGGVTTAAVKVGRDATVQGAAVNARLDSLVAGRDVTLAATAGDLTVAGTVAAARNLGASATGALRTTDLRADTGSASLAGTSVAAGAVAVGLDLTVRAGAGAVTASGVRVGRDLIAQAGSLNLGTTTASVARDISVTSTANLTSSSALSAGRNATFDVNGLASLGQVTATGALRILATDLNLTGVATAAEAQIESRTGGLRVGGAAATAAGGGGGLVFDSNDFAQLRVTGTTKFFAGSTTGTARGDLTLQDLNLGAGTPNVTFLVGSSNNAFVQGVVAPATSGGILRIGDATDLNWRPGTIQVTGSLGTATVTGGTTYSGVRAFDEVRLAARNDIVMGSQRFVTLVLGTAVADIDIAAGKPTGVAPTADEVNRIFVATGRLEVSSSNKVVQQNTSPTTGGTPVGVVFTGKFSPALIIDPPKIVELWGVLQTGDGKVTGGSAAGGAITFTVVDSNGATIPAPTDARYKFNSCDVGTSNCSSSILLSGGGSSGGGVVTGGGGGGSSGGGSSGGSTGGASGTAELGVSQISAGVLTARDGLPGGTGGGGGSGGSSNSNTSESSQEQGENEVSGGNVQPPPPLLAVTPPVNADEIVTDPVTTGAGSEEIWRKRRLGK